MKNLQIAFVQFSTNFLLPKRNFQRGIIENNAKIQISQFVSINFDRFPSPSLYLISFPPSPLHLHQIIRASPASFAASKISDKNPARLFHLLETARCKFFFLSSSLFRLFSKQKIMEEKRWKKLVVLGGGRGGEGEAPAGVSGRTQWGGGNPPSLKMAAGEETKGLSMGTNQREKRRPIYVLLRT